MSEDKNYSIYNCEKQDIERELKRFISNKRSDFEQKFKR